MSCLSLLLWHPLQLQHQLLLELPLHLQELLPLPIHLSLLVFQNLYFLALKRKQNCSYYWDEDYLGWGFFFARAWSNTLRTSWLSFAITIVSRGFSSASSSAAVSLLRLRWLLLSVRINQDRDFLVGSLKMTVCCQFQRTRAYMSSPERFASPDPATCRSCLELK